MNINMLVDQRRISAAINENIQGDMQFPILGKRKACWPTEPWLNMTWWDQFSLIFKNRLLSAVPSCCRETVNRDGIIPMEEMEC